MEERYFVWFHNYTPDGDDVWIETTKDLVEQLKPYEYELSQGNWSDTPYEDCVCDLLDNSDVDLRKSEIATIPISNFVEVAIC